MVSLKYIFYLCLIIAPASQAAAEESSVEVSVKQLDVALGGTGSVTCTPGGSPLPQVQWKKHGGQLGPRTKQTGNTLIISNAQIDDQGYYMCGGIVGRKVVNKQYVLVEVKEDNRPKRVRVSQQTLKIRRGQNGTVDCIPEGNPLPGVQWHKGKDALSEQARQEGNTLVITNAQMADAGTYVCDAIVESTAVWSAYLRVDIEDVQPPQSRPPVRSTQPQQSQHPVRTLQRQPARALQPQTQNAGNPRVRVSVRQLRISRGQSGTVDCIPEGYPLPRIQWNKEEGDFNSRVRPNGNTLVIYNAQDGDGGNYICNGLVDATTVWTEYVQVLIVPNREALPTRIVQYRPDQLPKPLDVSVAEGQDITISCDFNTGDDQQIVTWSRLDQRPLPHNVQQNGRELIFRRATTENAAEYLCKVTGGGFFLRQLYLRLAVLALPRVVIRPERTTVTRGDELTVECVAEGNAQVSWELVGGAFSSRVEHRGAQLVFRNIEVDDGGSYRCIARNRAGETAQTTQVVVTDVPRQPQGNPRVTVSEPQVRVPRGGSKKVECVPEGSPLPRVQWTKEEGDFGAGVVIEGNALIISNAQDEYSGNYVCSAIVQATPVFTAYLQVLVEDIPQPQTQPPQASPRVTVNVRQLTIPRGENGTVDCTPEGYPLPRVRWSKAEGKFSNGVRQVGNMLAITNAQDGDAGDYVCTGIVQATSVWMDYLQVVIEDVPRQPQGNPRVTVSEPQVRVPRGGSKKVECIPEGSPLPRVQWTKEEGDFGAGVVIEGNALIIFNAQAEYSGNYVCSAIVQATPVFTAYLQVLVEDVPRQPQGNPRVTVSEPQVRVPRGGSKKVECIPEGSPLPKVQWTKEEGDFGTGVVIEGNALIISDAQDEYSGNYVCSAIVQATPVFTAYLQVLVEDVPRQPQGNPRVTVSEPEVRVPRGGSKKVECIPEGSPLPRVQWTKEEGDFGAGVVIEDNALIISNAQAEYSGNYVCSAIVQATSVFTAYLQVLVEDVPRQPQGNPTVTVSEPQVRVPRGGSKKVECIPEGSPLPRVQWTKEEGDFGAGVVIEGNALIISDAQDEYSGNYVCSAIVQATPVFTAYLQVLVEDVERVAEPRTSDQNPPKVKVSESQVKIMEGESKTIDCNPEGYPLPTVQWTKEEGQFTSGTRQEGNALVISEAKEDDTGYYICSAIVDGATVYTDYLTVEVESGNKIDKSICKLALETSWCYGVSWYYDIGEHRCLSYAWGGCGGNANKFDSEEACSLACDGV